MLATTVTVDQQLSGDARLGLRVAMGRGTNVLCPPPQEYDLHLYRLCVSDVLKGGGDLWHQLSGFRAGHGLGMISPPAFSG